jgi:TonB-linked SusC/RagA family outer membrane protein
MRTKFNGILTLFLALIVQISFAQDRTISGTVTDESGPLPGVTVLKKGTTSGTETDFEGNYSIKSKTGDVLVFSFVGMKTVEKTVSNSSKINIVMENDNLLEEVVVTALGIKKEARSLGYGTDVVKGKDLVEARESNILNSLQGKATGVQITNSGGNVGGSSKVIIRGVSSLSGRNSPIWVVDGILINDSQTAGGSRISGNRDFGNGASVVNPDDVESLTILKGAAATALYGSRAAAGAIIVTTKRGKANPDGNATISVSSSLRVDDLFRVPDYQQEYAMGTQGKFDGGNVGFDWGPKISGQIVDNLPVTGLTGQLRAVKDNGIRDFFRTGYTNINNFSISDATERMDYRLSITSLNQTGIVPGSEFNRLNFNFNAGVKHSDKLESRFGIQYTNAETVGTSPSGANDPNIIGLSSFSSTLDQKLFTPWADSNGNQINQTKGDDGVLANNPLFLRNSNHNDREDDRYIGYFQLAYKPITDLSLSARVGFDLEDDRRLLENSKTTVGRLLGTFDSDNIRRNILTGDFIANYTTNLTDDLSLNLLTGIQYNSRLFERQRIVGTDLAVAELFSPGNAAQTVATRDFAESRLIGAYGSAELGYKNWATLTLTARNDWSSTLPKDNNSFFYPSASLAFVFTDAFDISNDILTYGKFRTSWAQVGNDTAAYQLDFTYNPISTATGQYGLNNNFPYNGALAYSKSNTIPPADLKPESQTSFEFGFDLRMFKNRLSIDFSYFNSKNEDQILPIAIPESTGFAERVANVGRVDQKGFEIGLDLTAISTDSFSWNTGINFSKVNSDVIELVEGLDRITLSSAFGNVQVIAEPGKPFQLYANDYIRDEETGRPIIDPTTGRRQAGDFKSFGSVLPDWTAGFTNRFSYKGFTLNATIDAKWGGVMKSSTVENLQTGGLVKETLVGREGTVIDTEGILVTTDPVTGVVTRTENNIPLRNAQDFWTSLDDGSVSAPFIFDASFVKLREVSLNYAFPSRYLNNGNGFFKTLSIGVEGRNLALLYSKVPHIDPESNLFGSGGAGGFGIERASTPSTRSVGLSVKMTF